MLWNNSAHCKCPNWHVSTCRSVLWFRGATICTFDKQGNRERWGGGGAEDHAFQIAKFSGIEASNSSERTDRSWWPCSRLTHVTNICIVFRATTCHEESGAEIIHEAPASRRQAKWRTAINGLGKNGKKKRNVRGNIECTKREIGGATWRADSHCAPWKSRRDQLGGKTGLCPRDISSDSPANVFFRYIAPAFLFRHRLEPQCDLI